MQRIRVLAQQIPDASIDALVTLDPSESHHLVHVLRAPIDAVVTVVDKASQRSYSAKLVRDQIPAQLQILKETTAEFSHFNAAHTLLVPLIKRDKNDWVCEKATELGIRHLIMWQAHRSVVRVESKQDLEKKVSRWLKICESASKQSNKNFVPEINCCSNLAEAIQLLSSTTDTKLLCSLAGAVPIQSLPHHGQQVAIALGPEGDLTAEEEQQFLTSGFKAISLGNNVLRSETAAIAAVAMVSALWDNPGNEVPRM